MSVKEYDYLELATTAKQAYYLCNMLTEEATSIPMHRASDSWDLVTSVLPVVNEKVEQLLKIVERISSVKFEKEDNGDE